MTRSRFKIGLTLTLLCAVVYWFPWTTVGKGILASLHEYVRQVWFDDGTGDRSHFWPDGQLRVLCFQREGKLEGLFQQWDSNGFQTVELTFVDGKINGPFRSWYPPGHLACLGEWEKGRRSGTWTFLDTNGNQIARLQYREGRSWQGTCAFYASSDANHMTLNFLTYEQGQLIEENRSTNQASIATSETGAVSSAR